MAAPDGHLRASDAERERIIEVLRRHTGDGRLTLEEFEERVGEALAATTRDDLEPVMRDLPPLPPVATAGVASPQRRVRWTSGIDPSAVLRAVAVAAAVTILLASGWQLWWIVFPLMAVFGGCGRGATSCASRRSRHHSDHRHRGRPSDVDREIIRV